MQLGTGIFLGALVLSGVLLYRFTQDRISWKKLLLWVFGFALIAALSLGAFVFFEDEIRNKQRAVAAVATPHQSMGGIALGISAADVMFRKGAPEEVEEYEEEASADAVWDFDDGMSLNLKNDRVVRVFTVNSEIIATIGNTVGDISEEDVFNTYGEPGLSKDFYVGSSIARIHSYPKLNLAFGMMKNKVVAAAVYEPENFLKGGLTPADALELGGECSFHQRLRAELECLREIKRMKDAAASLPEGFILEDPKP